MAPPPRNNERSAATRLSELSPSWNSSGAPTDSEIRLEPPETQRDQEDITTERPTAGVSFAALWEPNQRAPIAVIESCISAERYDDAVHQAASALALLLGRLPVPNETSMSARAMLVGLNGQEYLRLCRLASQPKETVTEVDALFALHMLIATRIKVIGTQRLTE